MFLASPFLIPKGLTPPLHPHPLRPIEPGIQLYTGGFLGGEIGREGKPYTRFGGMCLETQHYPDSINQPQWPSVVLRPGEKFASKTVFEFPTPSTLK